MFGNFEKSLKFSDVLIDDTKYGYKFDSSYYNIKGEVPIIDQSENYICGYTNLHVDKAPYKDVSIIFGDHTERFKYVDFEYYLGADGTKILKCKNKFNPYFVYWYMNINYLPCGGYSRHFKYLKELLFINPPIELQNQFADFVKHIDKLKFTIKQSIEKLNLCYQSLMQEYFE
jgi:type I restriction enzyme S subunit